MSKKVIATGMLGISIGILSTVGAYTYFRQPAAEPTDVHSHSSMSMDDMTQALHRLSGDSYDKAFIEMMIAHHQGAVDMAGLSAERAKHSEIKRLSRAIISAQEKEIADMKQWQQAWGYAADESVEMLHGNH